MNDVLKLAFEESARKLEVVEIFAESLRSRATLVLGSVTGVGTFLGSIAHNNGVSGCQWTLALSGILAYIGAAGFCLKVILPKIDGWEIGINTGELAGKATEYTLEETYKKLSKDYQNSFNRSKGRLKEMGHDVQVATILMVVELVCLSWLVAMTAATTTPKVGHLVPVVTTTTLP